MKDVLQEQRWEFSLDSLDPGFPIFLQVRLEYMIFFLFFFFKYYMVEILTSLLD